MIQFSCAERGEHKLEEYKETGIQRNRENTFLKERKEWNVGRGVVRYIHKKTKSDRRKEEEGKRGKRECV